LVGLVLVLRKPIRGLLPLLQRLKYKELEIEFGRRVEEVKQELAQELPPGAAQPTPEPANSALLRLAEVSPRAAVLEAWREVELAALEAARKVGGEAFRNRTLTFEAIRVLERSESLDRNIIGLLRDLRGLRNQAAHAPDFALTKESALEYAESALAVARYLRNMAGGG
jgi:hypothetical protein